jgi:hypothetical protein
MNSRYRSIVFTSWLTMDATVFRRFCEYDRVIQAFKTDRLGPPEIHTGSGAKHPAVMA